MKVLSPSYAEYLEKLEIANEQFTVRFHNPNENKKIALSGQLGQVLAVFFTFWQMAVMSACSKPFFPAAKPAIAKPRELFGICGTSLYHWMTGRHPDHSIHYFAMMNLDKIRKYLSSFCRVFV